jgi:hypothetical protein
MVTAVGDDAEEWNDHLKYRLKKSSTKVSDLEEDATRISAIAAKTKRYVLTPGPRGLPGSQGMLHVCAYVSLVCIRACAWAPA